jgi:hypothetical protein
LYYYNIHNILKVKSEVILYELEYFRANESENADLIVKVSKFKGGLQLRRKMTKLESHGTRNVRYSEHFGSLGAQFSIDFGTDITITVNKLIAKSKHVLYVNLVEPILRFMFISRGKVLLHSACVDKFDRAILISAPPDTGKTTTVLKCAKMNYSFLSDDMTIIKFPNEALCFPKPMTISAHTFNTLTSVSDIHDSRKGMKLRSLVHSKSGRSFMHKLANLNVPIFTINAIGQMIVKPPKYKIDALMDSVVVKNSGIINALYFLARNGNEIVKVNSNDALKMAVENSDDAFLFPPYKDLLTCINIGGKTAFQLLEQEKELLESLLSKIESFIIRSDSRSWSTMISQYTEGKVS